MPTIAISSGKCFFKLADTLHRMCFLLYSAVLWSSQTTMKKLKCKKKTCTSSKVFSYTSHFSACSSETQNSSIGLLANIKKENPGTLYMCGELPIQKCVPKVFWTKYPYDITSTSHQPVSQNILFDCCFYKGPFSIILCRLWDEREFNMVHFGPLFGYCLLVQSFQQFRKSKMLMKSVMMIMMLLTMGMNSGPWTIKNAFLTVLAWLK